MKNLLVVLCSLLILIAGTVFAGGESEAKAKGPIEIEVFNLDTGDNIKEAFNGIIEKYQAENPNIKVKMSWMGWGKRCCGLLSAAPMPPSSIPKYAFVKAISGKRYVAFSRTATPVCSCWAHHAAQLPMSLAMMRLNSLPRRSWIMPLFR